MVKIYRDNQANAIFIEDSNGVQFLNSLQATLETGSTQIEIRDLAKEIPIVSNTEFDDFVDENDNTYGGDAIDVCNALNSMFSANGDSQGNAPSITSNLSINLVEGETLNYELTADYGVGYEWDFSNVAGVVTVEGNPRKIIGGSGLSAGSYNIPVKAINYYGEDSQNITLTVSNPPFANTKSVNFNNQDWLGANAGILQNVLGRTSNGSGATDAWTIHFWFKGSSANQGQTIFYFGDADVANGGYIQIMQINSSGNKLLRLKYGSNNNNLRLQTAAGSITVGAWHQVVITYNGGTTGSAQNELSDYYSRFKIFIDGVEQTTNNSHSNYGYTGSVDPDNLRVGRFSSGNYMRNNSRVDELAIWDSDLSGSVSPDLYNNGQPFDLMTFFVQPKHWWRMGDDSDNYPYLFDYGSEANCIFIMNNMTVADIVSDVP